VTVGDNQRPWVVNDKDLSPEEDPAANAGALSPPPAWQDMDLWRICGGDPSINANAIVEDEEDDGGGRRRRTTIAATAVMVMADAIWHLHSHSHIP